MLGVQRQGLQFGGAAQLAVARPACVASAPLRVGSHEIAAPTGVVRHFVGNFKHFRMISRFVLFVIFVESEPLLNLQIVLQCF